MVWFLIWKRKALSTLSAQEHWGEAFRPSLYAWGSLFLLLFFWLCKAQATPGPDPEWALTGDERERYLDNLSDHTTARRGGADDYTCSLCDVWEGKQQTIWNSRCRLQAELVWRVISLFSLHFYIFKLPVVKIQKAAEVKQKAPLSIKTHENSERRFCLILRYE